MSRSRRAHGWAAILIGAAAVATADTSLADPPLSTFFGVSIEVVDMVPWSQGGESHQDSEPSLAVDPQNPLRMAASAFTPNPMEDVQSMLLSHLSRLRASRSRLSVAPTAGAPDLNGGIDTIPPEGLLAPIYVSVDGGNTWQLNPIIENANDKTGTNDITLHFGGRNGTLYAALLEGTSGFGGRICPGLDPSADESDEIFVTPDACVPMYGPRMVVRRTSDPTGSEHMKGVDGAEDFQDQPWVDVVSTPERDGGSADRVFVGFNDLRRSSNLFPGSLDADSRTASVRRSQRGNNEPIAIYQDIVMEPDSPLGENGSGVRVAVHPSGRVYGIFYHFLSKSGDFDPNGRYRANVVVVRDDDFAADPNPFTALTDPGDGSVGVEVAVLRDLPIRIPQPASEGAVCTGPEPDMGQERLVASDLSIAVHPRNPDLVYVAWSDSNRNAPDTYDLHVRRSEDAGRTWSSDLLQIPKTKNPALAINRRGTVGLLYQSFVRDGSARWETHFRRTADGESWSDILLADVPADEPACQFRPYLGDYVQLLSVDLDFYGVFSANNEPVPSHFPQRVSYQRPVRGDGKLLDPFTSGVVPPSIDPFFFKVTMPWFPDTKVDPNL